MAFFKWQFNDSIQKSNLRTALVTDERNTNNSSDFRIYYKYCLRDLKVQQSTCVLVCWVQRISYHNTLQATLPIDQSNLSALSSAANTKSPTMIFIPAISFFFQRTSWPRYSPLNLYPFLSPYFYFSLSLKNLSSMLISLSSYLASCLLRFPFTLLVSVFLQGTDLLIFEYVKN